MHDSARPQISILVPVYNVQDYLKECLASIAAQTFGDFEAICINDGSTDASRDIIARFLEKDTRFRVIDKPNSGYGASMNCGLDAAQGDYVAILESDDFFEKDTLERLHHTAREYDAEVVKANCYFYWSGPPAKNVVYDLVPHDQLGRVVNPQTEHRIFFLKPAIWAALYRRSLIEDNHLRFTETPGASYQDTAFNFKIWAHTTRAVFLKDAFVHYRQDNLASSVKAAGKVFCICDEFAEITQHLDADTTTPEWLYAIKAKLRYDTYMWNYERLADEYQWEFLQRFADEMREELESGHLDWQLFEEWNRLELQNILHSPEEYHQQRLAAGRSRGGKALHYLKSGGVGMLAKVIKSKLFHRY